MYSVLALGVVFLVSPLLLYADQFNDTYFTGDGSLPDLTHEVNGAGSKESIGLPPGTTPPDDEDDTGGDEETPGLPGEEEEGAGSQEVYADDPVPPQSTEEDGSPYVETEEDILSLLLGEGAILGVSSLLGGGSGFDFNSFSQGGFTIVVDGKKVRSAFGRSVSVKDILKFWKKSDERVKRGGKLTTGEYYAVVAAMLAEDDAQLDRAAFSSTQFEITYRSRGALFALIPWSFPVRVAVASDKPEGERVVVRFPWYHWFMREYFSRAELASEVDHVVALEVDRKEQSLEALQVRLLVAITEYLRQKVLTVTDSVLLGS